ncbi:hypothetical protein GCM10010433_21820 [Streptomyces pulveraceus]
MNPLHPSVAFSDHTASLLVVRANAPPWPPAPTSHGPAQPSCTVVSDDRSDVVGWLRLTDPWPETIEEARKQAGLPNGAECSSPRRSSPPGTSPSSTREMPVP